MMIFIPAKHTRRRLYHEITGKHLVTRLWDRRPQTPERITTLHEIPTGGGQVNVRYEENRNSYLNIFGYRPNTLEQQNKFSGFNKLEA